MNAFYYDSLAWVNSFFDNPHGTGALSHLHCPDVDLVVTTDSLLSVANSTEKQLLDMKHTVEPDALYLNEGAGKFRLLPEPVLAHKSLGHDVDQPRNLAKSVTVE